MKQYNYKITTGFFGLIGFTLCFLTAYSILPFKPSEKALIIAIADYPNEKGWHDLNADNDVELWEHTLKKRGCKKKDIHVLQDKDATKQGIIDRIKDFKGKIVKGDRVYFVFSGHGQQVKDDNGDEGDGYDEALVPYDSPLKYIDGINEGENLLRDDTIGILLNELRKAIGPDGQLIVIMDSCHSGTSTRGSGISRGSDEIMADSDYVEKHKQRAKIEERNNSEVVDSIKLAPMMAFYGSSSDEQNEEYYFKTEGKWYGSLCFAFTKALTESDDKATFQSIYDKIKFTMANIAENQTPEAEGALNYTLSNQRLSSKKGQLEVKKIIDRNNLILDGGALIGITENSKIGFYPRFLEQSKSTEPLFIGIVSAVRMTESYVTVEKGVQEEEIPNLIAKPVEKYYSARQEKIALNLGDFPFKDELVTKINSFRSFQIVENVDEAEILINCNNEFTGTDSLVISSNNNMIFYQKDLAFFKDKRDVNQILLRLQQILQAEFLRELEIEYKPMDVKLEILPFNKIGEKSIEYIPISQFVSNNDLVFEDSTFFHVKLINNSTLNIYYHVIDISKDKEAYVMFPNPRFRKSAEDCKLAIGDSIVLKHNFRFGMPEGMLKIIASVDEMPALRSILHNDSLDPNRSISRSERGNYHPFEILANQNAFGIDQTRASNEDQGFLFSEQIDISSLVYRVKPK